MDDAERRLQLQREEFARQMQRDEWNRQMQAEEFARQMQRDELNRMEVRRAHEAALRNKEAANRCANNDGQAVIGGLCPGCYAAMRQAEANAKNGVDKPLVTVILRDLQTAGLLRQPSFQPYKATKRADADRETPNERSARRELANLYTRNFDQFPQAQRIWERATKDGRVSAFESIRQEFWRIVNNSDDPDAGYIRGMLKEAGFQVGDGSAAPLLELEWPDSRRGRRDNARRLSIDHEVPRSKDSRAATGAGNLRFMLQDDNLRRRADYGRGDVPYDADRAEQHRRGETQRAEEARRRNREAANRCANNDGAAVVGDLCVGCFAAIRAAEAARSGDDVARRIYELMANVLSKDM